VREPFVVAGGIVRNRAWVLQEHLEAVAESMNRLPIMRSMFYVIGDSSDATEQILRANIVEYLRHDTGEPGYTRDGSDGPRYRSAHMAAERNLWAAEALMQWPHLTHLWVVDSDVLPAPDVLQRLLALEAPVAAAFVPTADGVTPIHMMGWDGKEFMARRTGEEKLLTKPHVATLVGGCYLIKRWVLGDADYGSFHSPWMEHPQGEDGGFAGYVRSQIRLPMMVDPLAKCEHRMERPRACHEGANPRQAAPASASDRQMEELSRALRQGDRGEGYSHVRRAPTSMG
jgi:hypothetical protein